MKRTKMKSYSPLLILFLLSAIGFGQHYESKYAVFDRKVVLVKGVNQTSELVCVVPKGNPVQIMEKVRGPIYKAQYKNWNGYIISFNLENKLKKQQSNVSREQVVRASSKKTYVTLSRKVYITKKGEYKMVLAVPKREVIEILDRVRKGKFLVRYKNHIGYADLGSFNIQNNTAWAMLSSMKINKSKDAASRHEQFPPIIDVDDISLSNNILHAGQSSQAVITLSNSGIGDADNVYVRLNSDNKGIEHPMIIHFPKIKGNGGVESVRLEIKGNALLGNGTADLGIEVIEPDFRGSISQRRLRFETVELPKPELVIPDYSVREIRSSHPNNRIDKNEMVELAFTMKNIGRASAGPLEIDVVSDQEGVIELGLVKVEGTDDQASGARTILPGAYHTISYRYFINGDFKDQELRFSVKGIDRLNRFDFSADLVFPLNQSGEFVEIHPSDNLITGHQYPYKPLLPEDHAILEDVDQDIPITRSRQGNAYALIIGNEDYRSRQRTLSVEQNAKYALNDAEVFANYCHRTLGIPARQIKVLRNATAAEMSQGLAWINNLSKIEEGDAKLIFYYSGHGLPDEETKSPVIIPVDVSANNLEYGIPLSDVFGSLAEHPANQVTVFLDACFSGGGRNQVLSARKGIKVKMNKNVILGNMMVLSSSSSEETSSIYRETKHGYFTYFLLKKLKETKGNIELEDLSTYVIDAVRKETGLNGIVQTPEVYFSQKVAESWQDWKLK